MNGAASDRRIRLARSRAMRRAVRFLFRYRGLRALGHAARRRLHVDQCVRISDFDGDLSFDCYLAEHIGSQMYWSDSYSWHQLQVLGRRLTSEMVFVDVGANQGEFTLFAAKRLSRGRVVAFEPVTEMFRRLQTNVEANRMTNVLAVRKALWSASGSRPIYGHSCGQGDGPRNEGLGTLFSGSARRRIEDAELTTLDEYLASIDVHRVDVIKIDVEGAELAVLRGARKTLDEHRPTLLLEADRNCAEAAGTSLEALLSFLEDRYRLERITRSGRLKPLTRRSVRRHQDLLCTAKSAGRSG